MGPKGFGTKNVCAAKNQQQFTRSTNIGYAEESCTTPKVVRQKDMVMSSAGLGTKYECADEDQKQFILPDPDPI
jgi:hypothetical protein